MTLYPEKQTQANPNYVPPASVKKEPNVDIHTAWRDGYDTGSFEAIMNLTGGHKCKHPKAVIYCKDCKFYESYQSSSCWDGMCMARDLRGTDDEDYCSYAELKENNK